MEGLNPEEQKVEEPVSNDHQFLFTHSVVGLNNVLSYNQRDGLKKLSKTSHCKNRVEFIPGNHYTCQVGQDRLFAYNSSTLNCQMVFISSYGRTFKIKELAKTFTHRNLTCMVNIDDKQIFLIGGVDFYPETTLSSVSRYTIAENSWDENMPALVVPRASSSGCYVGRNIFVFGG